MDNEVMTKILEATLKTQTTVEKLNETVKSIKYDVKDLKQDVASMKQDISDLKQDVANMKQEITEIKQEIDKLKVEIALTNKELDMFRTKSRKKLEELETRMKIVTMAITTLSAEQNDTREIVLLLVKEVGTMGNRENK